MDFETTRLNIGNIPLYFNTIISYGLLSPHGPHLLGSNLDFVDNVLTFKREHHKVGLK